MLSKLRIVLSDLTDFRKGFEEVMKWADKVVLNEARPIINAVADLQLNTITHSRGLVRGNAAAGDITVTLPPAASCVGLTYTVKKIDPSANLVNARCFGSELADGSNNFPLGTQFQSVDFFSIGSGWDIL